MKIKYKNHKKYSKTYWKIKIIQIYIKFYKIKRKNIL